MRASAGFLFFMLFLAGLAFVNLRGMRESSPVPVTSAEQLADVAWRPTNIAEMRLADDTRMTMRFDTGGKVAGDAGCNRFTGSYALKDGKLTFGTLVTSRMACPEPANSFEISFLEALDNTRTAVRAGDRLSLRDDKARSLLRLVKGVGSDQRK